MKVILADGSCLAAVSPTPHLKILDVYENSYQSQRTRSSDTKIQQLPGFNCHKTYFRHFLISRPTVFLSLSRDRQTDTQTPVKTIPASVATIAWGMPEVYVESIEGC